LHTAGRDTAPDNRQQAHATFILGKHFDRSAVGAIGTLLL
jgi:hypothetical protein